MPNKTTIRKKKLPYSKTYTARTSESTKRRPAKTKIVSNKIQQQQRVIKYLCVFSPSLGRENNPISTVGRERMLIHELLITPLCSLWYIVLMIALKNYDDYRLFHHEEGKKNTST